jgi:hypothetical protein
MPWKECHAMEERLRFVARLLDGEKMVAAAEPLPRRFAHQLAEAVMKLLGTALLMMMMTIGTGSTMSAAQSASVESEGAYVFGLVGRGGFAVADAGAPAFGGLLVGAGAGHVLPHGWFVEGVADQLVNYRSNDSGDKGDVNAFIGRVGHRWGPPSQAFRPYIAFAIGVARDRWRTDDGDARRANGAIFGAVLGGDIRKMSAATSSSSDPGFPACAITRPWRSRRRRRVGSCPDSQLRRSSGRCAPSSDPPAPA